MAQYQVYCHSCDVTFPPDTKVCIHCGARTHPEPLGKSVRAATARTVDQVVQRAAGPGASRWTSAGPARTVDQVVQSAAGPGASRWASAGPTAFGGSREIAADAGMGSGQIRDVPAFEDAGVEEGAGSRSMLRAGMSVLWMIVLAAAYAWRACTG